MPVITLASTIAGDLAIADGMVYYLSPCCHASAKGCDGYTGCRKCYQPIADVLGDAWMVRDEAGWGRFAQFLQAPAVGLPEPMAMDLMVSVAKHAAEVA